MKRSIDDLNRLDRTEFVRALADVAEHSPWVAEAAADARPFADRDALVAAFARALREAPATAQLALVRAHPDLAGRLTEGCELTRDSRREQAGAGLDRLASGERERFLALNARYSERFGFPFILAVKGAGKDAILAAFEARLGNSPETEFETALGEIARIFRFRIEDRVAG